MAEFENKKVSFGRRQFVAGSLAAGVLATLYGCGQKNSGGSGSGAGTGVAGEPKKGGTFRLYINNPACIDPFNLKESEGTLVASQLFTPLTGYDFKAQKLVPLACEKWESDEKAETFTFHLRPGATFHNGDPVTSKDFKRAWERIVNPNTNPSSPSEISYHLSAIKGYEKLQKGEAEGLDIECPDDNTLIIHLNSAFADFAFVTAHPALSPVPKVALDDFAKFFKAPIGNGPFKMQGEWVDGQYIKVVRFEEYFGKKPLVDGIDYLIYKDPNTAFTDFKSGNLDFASIPEGQIKSASAEYGVAEDGYTTNPGKQCILGENTAVYYLACNNKDPLFSKVDVRKAVSLGINRQAIVDTLFEGSRVPADGILPPGITGYQKGLWEDSVYDVERAKKAFDVAGYPDNGGSRGLKFELSCNSGGGHENIMQSIQADMKKLGVEVEIKTTEWAAYLTDLEKGNYQIGRLGWNADYPIGDNFLFPLFKTDNGDNHSGYSNAEVDKALEEARKILDDDKRAAAYTEIARKVGKDMPVIPIVFYRFGRVTSKRVHNFYLGPTQLFDITDTWLDQ